MYLPNCASISPPFLKYEKIGKVLLVGYSNTRVGTYQNVGIDNNVIVSYFTHESKDCIMLEYGRLLIVAKISVWM